MLTDTWRTHSFLSPRTGHRAAWLNPQRSHETAPDGCTNVQTPTLPSHHMRCRPGSALYRQSRWHGNCFLESYDIVLQILSHPERGESCANILARGRQGSCGIAGSITFWREGQAATRPLADGQAILLALSRSQGQCTVPPPWKRPARVAP
jgi:hypothetical protein